MLTSGSVMAERERSEQKGALSGVKGLVRATALPFLFSAMLASSTSGCAGSRFNGVEYRDKEVAFRLGPLPSGSRELQADDAKLSLQNDEIGATVAVAARCGQDSDDVPLKALLAHLFIQFTDRQILSEEELTLDGRAALEMELTARLDGVPRHFLVAVLKKNGCVYDFLHVDGGGDDARLIQSRDDFRQMVRGFQTLQ